MALTVAELANVIRRPEADRAAVVERLRTWTEIGLLAPAGERNPGTGKRRAYDDAVIYDAAILNSLADAGFQIGKARYFMVVMLLAERAKDAWAREHRAGLFLEVADFVVPNPQGETHAVFLHEGEKHDHLGGLIHPRSEGSYILPVSKLFARIEKNMEALTAERSKSPEVADGPKRA
jgi:DNA-binding transcriptional MerR regulator